MNDADFAALFQRRLGLLVGLTVAHALVTEWPRFFALDATGRSPLDAAAPWVLAFAALLSGLGFAWRHPGYGLGAVLALGALHARVPSVYHNNYYLLGCMVALTALTRLGRAEGLLRPLLRAQLAVVYLVSVVVKLSHPWWNGSGRVLQLLATEYVPGRGGGLLQSALGPWLADPGRARFTDQAVMLAEVLLPVCFYLARWRRAALWAGVAMHLVMHEWLFPQVFSVVMLLGYLAWRDDDVTDDATRLLIAAAITLSLSALLSTGAHARVENLIVAAGLMALGLRAALRARRGKTA